MGIGLRLVQGSLSVCAVAAPLNPLQHATTRPHLPWVHVGDTIRVVPHYQTLQAHTCAHLPGGDTQWEHKTAVTWLVQ
jgi:hypothetical protein